MKTAVVLFGFLRTFEKTANSLKKHIIEVNDADLFVFAPDRTGIICSLEEKIGNDDTKLGGIVSEARLREIYGDCLKACELWQYDENIFQEEAEKYEIKTVANINPVRIFSMFYHIKKSLQLLQKYEENHNIKYDNIILTRPDLAFYSGVDIKGYDLGNINVTKYRISLDNGAVVEAQAPVFYYKNAVKGILISNHRYVFNDPIVISQHDNIMKLSSVYDRLSELIADRFPFNPESIIWYVLIYLNKLKLDLKPIEYETFRANMKEIENVSDLDVGCCLSKEKLRLYRFRMFVRLWLKLRYKYFNKPLYYQKKAKLKCVEKEVRNNGVR